MTVLLLFLLALAAGSLLALPWLPGRDLGPGYFRIQALVALGLLTLAGAATALRPELRLTPPVVVGGREVPVGILLLGGAASGLVAYHALVARERFRLALAPLVLATVAATLLLLLAGPPVPTPPPLRFASGVRGVSRMASAVLLGWSLGTMLLGHWYLVLPRLRFDHLRRYCALLVGWVTLRGVTVGAVLLLLASADRLDDAGRLDRLLSLEAEGSFFWLRVLWGLAIPLVLGSMAWSCARRRANQSATGILYVLVMGVLIGEIVAFHLARTTGWPV